MLPIAHSSQALLLIRVQLVNAAHQQSVLTDGIQENVGFLFEIGGSQSNQQLASLARAEVHQRRQVVFAKTRLASDHKGAVVLVFRSLD